MIKKHGKKFITFCFIGTGAFLIDWLGFNFLYGIVGLSFIFSIILSWFPSAFFNFNMNRKFTFSSRKGPLKKQLPRWLTVQGTSFLVRVGLSNGILMIIGETWLYANIAFMISVGASLLVNFFGSLLWAFKKEESS